MNIINTLKSFFTIQDWRFIIAGLIMIAIFLLIVYLLSVIVISFQKRKAAVNVSLPDIDSYNKKDKIVKQFEESEDLEVELIDANDDVIKEEAKNNENLFMTALSIETGQYIPKADDKIDMPEIGDIDYETIKIQKTEKAKEKTKKKLERLKKIAKADEEGVVEEKFINIDDGDIL